MICNVRVNMILDDLVSGTTYLGLCSEEPASSDGAVSSEPTASSYARKKLSGVFTAAEEGILANAEEIQMISARENWGTCRYFFVSQYESASAATDASATHDAIFWGKIYDKDGNEGIAIDSGTVPVFYKNELRASIDVELT